MGTILPVVREITPMDLHIEMFSFRIKSGICKWSRSITVELGILNFNKLFLWCLMPLSTIFQLYRGGQIYWWRKTETTTDLPQVTDKLYHVIFSPVRLAMNGVRTPTLVVIGTDCRGCCKFNYHTTKAMTAPCFFGYL